MLRTLHYDLVLNLLLGVATIILVIILLLLCVIRAFPCHRSLYFLWSKGVHATVPCTYTDRKVFMPPVVMLFRIKRCSCYRSLYILWSKGVHASRPYTFSDRKVFIPPFLIPSLIERYCNTITHSAYKTNNYCHLLSSFSSWSSIPFLRTWNQQSVPTFFIKENQIQETISNQLLSYPIV